MRTLNPDCVVDLRRCLHQRTSASRRPARRGTVVAPALALLVLCPSLLLGCGNWGPRPGDGAANAWLELLRRVPSEDLPDPYMVLLYDYQTLRRARDMPLPARDAGLAGLEDYRQRLVGDGTRGSDLVHHRDLHQLGGVGRPSEEQQGQLGFTLADVDQELLVEPLGPNPPPSERRLAVARGRFDAEAIQRVLRAGSMGDDRDEGTYQGVTYQHWGVTARVNLRQRREPLRERGEERALAVVDGTLLFSDSTSRVQRMIDCTRGSGPCLADRDGVRVALEELTSLRTYTAALVYGPAPALVLPSTFLDERLPPLEPYVVAAAGAGVDAGGDFLGIVLVHADEASATRNAQLLADRLEIVHPTASGRQWREVLNGVETTSHGRSTLARLYGEQAAKAWKRVIFDDGLLLHREHPAFGPPRQRRS